MRMKNSILFLACFCLLGLHLAQAQIELSTYISAGDVANSIKSCCESCSYPIIQNVMGDNNVQTPYTYTFCGGNPPMFSLDVGMCSGEKRTFFKICGCDKYQFIALDLSMASCASQFYWDCRQAFLYKCRDGYVFNQPTGKCIQASSLNYGISVETPGFCYIPPPSLPLSAFMCESLVYPAMPAVCRNCTNPFVQHVLKIKTSGFVASSCKYTYCLDDGRISLDLVNNGQPHTFLTPDCKYGRMVQALDPTRKTKAAQYYYDCRVGLIKCPEDTLFDPMKNTCTTCEGDFDKLKTGLEYCPKTCGVVSYAQPAYGAYKPQVYAAPQTNYLPPFVNYGK